MRIVKDGYFTKEYLRALPSDNLESLIGFYDEYQRYMDSLQGVDQMTHTRACLESLAILRALCKVRGIKLVFPDVVDLQHDKQAKQISDFFYYNSKEWRDTQSQRTSRTILSDTESKYESYLLPVSVYEFSDDELKRIQNLINELRDYISSSNLIGDDHKRRLLKRLEAMQSELHKDTSDIDRFWGFIGEAGVVARKFGEDMKPITDRVRELCGIVFRVIMIKEGIHHLPDISSQFSLPTSTSPAPPAHGHHNQIT